MSDLFPTVTVDGVQYIRLSDYSVAVDKLITAESKLDQRSKELAGADIVIAGLAAECDQYKSAAAELRIQVKKLGDSYAESVRRLDAVRKVVEDMDGNVEPDVGCYAEELKTILVERQSTNVTAHMHNFGPEDEHKISRCECGAMMVPINYG